MRFNLVVLLVALAMFGGGSAFGQSTNASISGVVLDPDKRSIPDSEILVVNDYTRVQYGAKTNAEGFFAVTNLPPGQYRIQVSKVGFKAIIKPDIILNVQDALAITFTLPIGASSVVVTVEGGAPIINTTDAAVSTVVDHSYVENMPLNGRSLQDLILLTPGVVTNAPNAVNGIGVTGEFSVNGQRTESNYYTVDGVSANIGIFPSSITFPSASGSLPASTALGTTQGLVSVDALEEFRVRSSSDSAEYGRSPGGQFNFATRSGTNQFHGTGFNYLRNNVFDANDWFNDYYGLPQPALRQNDFGGTLGGPIQIPHVYRGKDKTFFFFSYEGVRLAQPQEATLSYVPTQELRNAAPAALQPVLNAFPLPRCASLAPNCTVDLGNGLGDFVGSWSIPSSIDSFSVRFDEALNDKLKLFFRLSDTSSSAGNRGLDPAVSGPGTYATRTYTAGASGSLPGGVSNEFRANYSTNLGAFSDQIRSFEGAEAVDLAQLQGINTQAYPASQISVFLELPGYTAYLFQSNVSSKQRQWNFLDTVSLSIGRNEIKAGVDYRRLAPIQQPTSPAVSYGYFSETSIETNNVDFGTAENSVPARPVYQNFSAFGEDAWRASPRLVLSFGLRWEVNPAPGAPKGNLPCTADGSNLSTLRLDPEGTSLWKTSWYNLAPRLGAAYILRIAPGYVTVLRAGGGVFFDTGQQLGSIGYSGPGFTGIKQFGTFFDSQVSFPAPLQQVSPVLSNPPVPPYNTVYSFGTHLQLPYTLQWNTTFEQQLGKSQSVTVAYVGARGRRLLEESQVNVAPFNPSFSYVDFVENGLTSDYDALQVQAQHALNHGLTALVSYTWSHAIDYGSQNNALPYLRGNADFDVRHNLSAAFSYDLPSVSKTKFLRDFLHNWGLDARLTVRTGFPVTLDGSADVNPATGQTYYTGLDLVPGKSTYIYGSEFPGGRSINPAAFALPPLGQSGDAPRNFVRGLGASQVDLAMRREFPIHERLKLQFRAEAFNLLNHPDFGTVNATYCSPGPFCTFGQATSTLAESLGVLSPLYQIGGPRSLQFALKLKF